MIERKKHLIFFFFSFFFFFISRWSSNESKSIDRWVLLDTDFWIRLSPVVQDQILFLPRITESLIIYIIACTQRWMIQRGNEHTRLYIYCPCICLQWTTKNFRRRNDGRLMMDRRWIRAQFLTRRGKRFNNWRTNVLESMDRYVIINSIFSISNEILFSRLLFSLGKKNSNERYTEDADRVVGYIRLRLLSSRCSTIVVEKRRIFLFEKKNSFFPFLFGGGVEGGDEDNNVRLDFNNTCGSSSP